MYPSAWHSLIDDHYQLETQVATRDPDVRFRDWKTIQAIEMMKEIQSWQVSDVTMYRDAKRPKEPIKEHETDKTTARLCDGKGDVFCELPQPTIVTVKISPHPDAD